MVFAVSIFSEGFDKTHLNMPLQSTLTFFQNIAMITKTFKEATSIEIKGIKVPADGVCCPNFQQRFCPNLTKINSPAAVESQK